MSTIRVIYSEEPKFPATSQHPDALRYHIGNLWVDAIGGQPTQEEIDAVLIPVPSFDGASAFVERQRGQASEELDAAIEKLPSVHQEAFKLMKQLLQE